jgi:hypothetical protein
VASSPLVEETSSLVVGSLVTAADVSLSVSLVTSLPFAIVSPSVGAPDVSSPEDSPSLDAEVGTVGVTGGEDGTPGVTGGVAVGVTVGVTEGVTIGLEPSLELVAELELVTSVVVEDPGMADAPGLSALQPATSNKPGNTRNTVIDWDMNSLGAFKR